MKLSEHFTLEEFVISQTAVRLDIDNGPDDETLQNLVVLCKNVLEPIRELINKPIKISSGYRCPELNKAIGGAPNSQHQYGEAADFIVLGWSIQQTFNFLRYVDLPIDQCIQEFNSWIHISHSDINRHEFLRAVKENGRTVYLEP